VPVKLLLRCYDMLILYRPSGDFLPFESAAMPPVPVMQVTSLAASVPASAASTASAVSNVDLLGDLDILQPSMPPTSVPVQQNSFAPPPASVPQSNTFAMMGPTMAYVPVMPYASPANTSVVPGAASAAAAMESVCMSMHCLC